jgi:hypothetical protein
MPRYRFSDKFSLIYDFFIRAQKNDIGFVSNVDTNSSDISMGRRDRTTFNNTITSKFSLNNVMNLNLSLRHYLSHATYNRISILQNDGSLVTNGFNLEEYNRNYNTWNLDLSYTWWFAPGSQVSVLYRNNSVTEEDKFTGVDNRFESNIKKSLNHQNLDHIFSISVRYFIDYNSTKNWSSKK